MKKKMIMNSLKLPEEKQINGLEYIHSSGYYPLMNNYINRALSSPITIDLIRDFYLDVRKLRTENMNAYHIMNAIFRNLISARLKYGLEKNIRNQGRTQRRENAELP